MRKINKTKKKHVSFAFTFNHVIILIIFLVPIFKCVLNGDLMTCQENEKSPLVYVSFQPFVHLNKSVTGQR